MPWRREEVAPYCYDNVYTPSTTEQFYYSTYTRSPEQMREAQKNADKLNAKHRESKRNPNFRW